MQSSAQLRPPDHVSHSQADIIDERSARGLMIVAGLAYIKTLVTEPWRDGLTQASIGKSRLWVSFLFYLIRPIIYLRRTAHQHMVLSRESMWYIIVQLSTGRSVRPTNILRDTTNITNHLSKRDLHQAWLDRRTSRLIWVKVPEVKASSMAAQARRCSMYRNAD